MDKYVSIGSLKENEDNFPNIYSCAQFCGKVCNIWFLWKLLYIYNVLSFKMQSFEYACHINQIL